MQMEDLDYEVPSSYQFPKKLKFLFEPAPYKICYGGRLGLKTINYAAALILMGSTRSLRVLCARETMASIRESVHLTLCDAIKRLGLQDHYKITEYEITGKHNDTMFTFAGLHHNVSNIKSLESYDILWVEEAQNVSKNSWSTIIPTIRKEGAEIWVSFNPRLSTDDTYTRFVVHPPPGAIVLKTSWRDNPWISQRAWDDLKHLERTDYKDFLNVYEGECLSNVKGAIYAEELELADAEGRIGLIPYNRSKPVDTCWDLGFGDLTSIWFVQAYDGFYNFIDYYENDGKRIEHYLVELQRKSYLYGLDWVPHDAVDAILHKNLTGNKEMSVEMLMRNSGRKLRMVPKFGIFDQINAARTVLPQCRFDKEKCADGIQALRNYQWGEEDEELSGGPNDRKIRKAKPLHNWASHASSAFNYACFAVRQPRETPRAAKEVSPYRVGGMTTGGGSWMG